MPENDQPTTSLPFRRIVWPLAVAETIVWAAYYYAFPALLLTWERDLGWSKTELSGAFTLSLVMSAALAPVVGRLIDRGFALVVFAGGAVLGAALLATLSTVTELWQFYLVWLGLGVAMAATLYEACFTLLTSSLGQAARRGITTVALVAGFAGTVSFPSAHILSNWVGWRGTVLIFAVVVMVVAVPLIAFACRNARPGHRAGLEAVSPKLGRAFHVMKRPTFWWLAALFATIAVNHGILLTHLLPILDARGIEPGTAVLAASMIGPMQVFGRLIMTMFGRRATTFAIFIVCLIATTFAALALLNIGVAPLLLFFFVALQGAGYGVTSIVRPVFVAERLGRQNFGMVAGLLAIAFVGGSAASPTVAALIWEIGGYNPVIWSALGMSVIGILALVMAAAAPITPVRQDGL